MQYKDTIATLLENACPSIQYRIRKEILGQSPTDRVLTSLQASIIEDDLVKKIFSWQQPDGWLGRDFHGFESIETGIRVLAEKGVNKDHPVFSRALDALENGDDRLHLGIGKVGMILDDLGFGGSQRIRAAVFSYANAEDRFIVKGEISKTLKCFSAVPGVPSISEITEEFGARKVFKPGVLWPDVYALRLLAFTQEWRSQENIHLIGEAIQRLVELSPIPDIYVRYKSQWMAPGSFAMHDINPDMAMMDDQSWMVWFHRMEMFARLGIVATIPILSDQISFLRSILEEGEGFFTKPLSHYFFHTWGTYSGLRLEKDWRSTKRRTYDLTFRSLLILHYTESIIGSTKKYTKKPGFLRL